MTKVSYNVQIHHAVASLVCTHITERVLMYTVYAESLDDEVTDEVKDVQ